MIQTLVPGRESIKLYRYYDDYVDYYVDCEMDTKRWFVQNAKEDWNYLDCGANIGYYSILFSQLSPRGFVYAIEPTDTIDMLIDNISYNKVTINIWPYRVAVGSVTGLLTEPIYKIWGREPEIKEYRFMRIDDLVPRLKIERLDCIKIDVDSYDYEALLGAEDTLDKFNPWLVIELNSALHKRGHSPELALQWLRKKGYSSYLLLDRENYVMRR